VHVEAGQLRRFAGDYNYYVEKTGWGTSTSLNNLPKPTETKGEAGVSAKELRRIEAEERQVRSRAKKQQETVVREIEKRISTLETRQSEIHLALQEPETYSKGALAAELNRELKELKESLDQLHQEWETEAMRLEGLSLK